MLATGGYSALYDTTSNDETATGDGISIAYRAGAQVTDLEFVQFHPTMLAAKADQTYLISEAVRGEGAKLIDQHERSIMTGIHEAEELAPRDIVSRAIANEQAKGNQVYLDIRPITHFTTKFPFITSVCEKHNISVKGGLIPIRPGAHFTMGGVVTNFNGETAVPGLYAIGEVACTHVHGANRLASNSLLEGIVFANRLADHLLLESPVASFHHFQSYTRKVCRTTNHPTVKILKKMMSNNVGITREKQNLEKMATWLSNFSPLDCNLQSLTHGQVQMNHMLLVASLITQSAQKRTESRGAHFRTDFPYQIDNWKKRSISHQLKKEHRRERVGI